MNVNLICSKSQRYSLPFIFAFVYLFLPIGFCFIPQASASAPPEAVLKERSLSNQTITLFAKAGSGDYYTLYPDGVKKEDAYIGGLRSAQLDPLEENIYFFDTTLKVIAKINLKDGKVSKVIGKPKSTASVNYSAPVKFADANLSKLIDFTFDKYGNIFILDNAGNSSSQNPRILKASLKDSSIKEVLNVSQYFQPNNTGYGYGFDLKGLSYDKDKNIFIYGSGVFPAPSYGVSQWEFSTVNGQLIIKFDVLSNIPEIYGGISRLTNIGFNPRLKLDTQNLSVSGISFDHDKNCFLHGSASTSSGMAYNFTDKVVTTTNTDGSVKLTFERFLGDENTDPSELGDGGQAKSAYLSLTGPRCFCGDKSGDIFLADIATNRIRKVLHDTGLITTVAGGGKDSLSFGELKPLGSVSLNTPNSLLVDKSNNLYIVDSTRILLVKNLITHEEKPQQEVKTANLKITKIASLEIENPKGEVTVPDLTLDYTRAGDQNVEVRGENIPDGTNVKLLAVNSDGTTVQTNSQAKLTSGLAVIPVKVEAGTTKIIKAETDPFIPAPGVYLSGTEPQITAGVLPLPNEPFVSSLNRNTVNTNNFLPLGTRFNFSSLYDWKTYYADNLKTTNNSSSDPDNLAGDGTLFEFGSTQNTLFLDNIQIYGANAEFSVWMRTDSGNINVPIAIGGASSNHQWYIAVNQPWNSPSISYTSVTVTPQWQKFTIKSNANALWNYKTVSIGGLAQTYNTKFYVWGAKVEQVQ